LSHLVEKIPFAEALEGLVRQPKTKSPYTSLEKKSRTAGGGGGFLILDGKRNAAADNKDFRVRGVTLAGDNE